MTRSLASKSAALDRAIVAALAAQGQMRVRDLQSLLRVRRQALLQAVDRLKKGGAIKPEPRRVEIGGKRPRTILAYALVPRPSEPGSRGGEPGSHTGSQSGLCRPASVAPSVIQRRRQCLCCNTIWVGSGGPWCADCVPVERPGP